MAHLTFFEKRRIPIYDDPAQIESGTVEFDLEKCANCGLCAKICPADCIEIKEKKPRMVEIKEIKARIKEPSLCMMCSDCVAICPEGAIVATRNYRFTGRYKTLGVGNLQPPRL